MYICGQTCQIFLCMGQSVPTKILTCTHVRTHLIYLNFTFYFPCHILIICTFFMHTSKALLLQHASQPLCHDYISFSSFFFFRMCTRHRWGVTERLHTLCECPTVFWYEEMVLKQPTGIFTQLIISLRLSREG